MPPQPMPSPPTPLESTLVGCLGHESLHLILVPSEACDVRCASCPPEPAAGRMRPEVVRGVKNLLTDRAEELDSLTLSWSGGEPLLALGVMEEVLEHACALGLAFPDLAFQSDVTTNANLLDPGTFVRLHALGVDRFQVPVEGPLPVPPHAPGGPSLGAHSAGGRTWSHLRALRGVRGDFVVEVRALVDAEREVSTLVEAFRFVFADDERFRLIVRRPLAESGALAGLRELARSALRVPPRVPAARRTRPELVAGPDGVPEDGEPSGLGSQAGGAQAGGARAARLRTAAHVFPDAYVVRADGRIGTCTWPRRPHPTGRDLGRLGEEGRMHLDDGPDAR